MTDRRTMRASKQVPHNLKIVVPEKAMQRSVVGRYVRSMTSYCLVVTVCLAGSSQAEPVADVFIGIWSPTGQCERQYNTTITEANFVSSSESCKIVAATKLEWNKYTSAASQLVTLKCGSHVRVDSWQIKKAPDEIFIGPANQTGGSDLVRCRKNY